MEALAAEGFDRLGRALGRQGDSRAKSIQSLRGTLELLVKKNLITARIGDVKKEAGSVVKKILESRSSTETSRLRLK